MTLSRSHLLLLTEESFLCGPQTVCAASVNVYGKSLRHALPNHVWSEYQRAMLSVGFSAPMNEFPSNTPSTTSRESGTWNQLSGLIFVSLAMYDGTSALGRGVAFFSTGSTANVVMAKVILACYSNSWVASLWISESSMTAEDRIFFGNKSREFAPTFIPNEDARRKIIGCGQVPRGLYVCEENCKLQNPSEMPCTCKIIMCTISV